MRDASGKTGMKTKRAAATILRELKKAGPGNWRTRRPGVGEDTEAAQEGTQA